MTSVHPSTHQSTHASMHPRDSCLQRSLVCRAVAGPRKRKPYRLSAFDRRWRRLQASWRWRRVWQIKCQLPIWNLNANTPNFPTPITFSACQAKIHQFWNFEYVFRLYEAGWHGPDRCSLFTFLVNRVEHQNEPKGPQWWLFVFVLVVNSAFGRHGHWL